MLILYIGLALFAIRMVFRVIRSVIRSKLLIATSIYLGGYVYYNKTWPSLEPESIQPIFEEIRTILMLMQ